MKFSYHWLKELTSITDTPQELAEFLTMRVFEVEEIKRSGDNWTLDIKLLPNRMADASGHTGMAREIAALKKSKLNPRSNRGQKSKIAEDKKLETSDFVKIKIEDADDCPRYTARVMTGVKVGPSPAWIRERLAACGLSSINNVVDAANYVMLETGQPLHIFDADKIGVKNMEVPSSPPAPMLRRAGKFQVPKTIIVRRARKGERMEGLDDTVYELNPDILVIADEKEPIAIAGIKGGKGSGVSAATRTIILESANFDPIRIRLGSKTLGLRTDASYRFEHGMDPNETQAAVDRLAELIQQIANGVILKGTADAYPSKIRPANILFRPEYANRLIGEQIPPSFYKTAFARIGWNAVKKDFGFVVEPPTARRDITIEEDIVEEIARLFDYQNIPPRMPEAMLSGSATHENLFWEERMRDVLIGAGYTESELYQFTGDREANAFRIPKEALIPLENPASEAAKYLVPRLAIKYAASAAENLRNFDEVRIFGIGKSCTRIGNQESGIMERKDLVLARARKGNAGEQEFYELKGAVDTLLESLGISDHWYDDHTELGTCLPAEAWAQAGNLELGEIYHPYRVADIKIGDEKIGAIGEIHPAVLNNIKANGRIAAAEIDFEKLARMATAEAEFRPIGKYPAIVRDIAVVVPADAKTQDIENIIQAAGGDLLADTDLFDYFQDEDMRGSEEKSLAFHLVFQSSERTLTDAEVDSAIKKIIDALEAQNWEVKK